MERNESAVDIAREDDFITVRFVGADGNPGHPHQLVSPWVPGDPVWQGSVDGHPVAMQVRPIPNGFRLAHQGFEVAVNVFAGTAAPPARVVPGKGPRDTGKEPQWPMAGALGAIGGGRRPAVK